MLASHVSPKLTCRLASSASDILGVQRLRYQVFVKEWGATGCGVDHARQVETDQFDAYADHLLLIDPTLSAGEQIVGTYRMMTTTQAKAAGGFYSAHEYDLSVLLNRNADILELGRSCLHPAYRGGTALLQLWQGVGRYVTDHGIDVLFGVASFRGTDAIALAQPLSLLHSDHLAPPSLRVKAREPGACAMDLLPADQRDRRAAMLQMPALIKAYLRLGGVVGEGAYIDRDFNTMDVCLILEAARMTARQRALYGGGPSDVL